MRTMADDTPRALRLMQRMDRLGLSARDLAKRAGVDRAAVATARQGRARSATYGLLEKALDAVEYEAGVDLVDDGHPPPTLSTITLPDGTVVTFEGDATGVALAVAKFLAQQGKTPVKPGD